MIISKSYKEWTNLSHFWGNKLHKTCYYTGMCPPRVINFLLKKYSNENDLIVDTFCGRGTTLLEARILNRKFIGTDLNPLAYVLSKSKSIVLNPSKIDAELDRLEHNYKAWELNNNRDIKLDEILLIYYSSYNLKQLYYLREVLGNKWESIDDEKTFLLSIILGLLHGLARKNGKDSSYFSLNMSNTTAMSPNYIKNYSLKHNLMKFEFNLFDKIRIKVKKILSKIDINQLNKFSNSNIYFDNAMNIKSYVKNHKVDLFITSPPYLNMINYTNQNWLKLWLLGYERSQLKSKIKLDDNLNLKQYLQFIKNYLIEVTKLCYRNTKIILIIGDITINNKNISFLDYWVDIKYDIDLDLKEIIIDEINQAKKATNSLGNRKGKSTKRDIIYIFEKRDNL